MRIYLLPIFLVVLCACPTKPYALKHQDRFSGTGSNEVYVISHGWHTGFVVPAKDIQIKIPKLKNRFASSKYIEFGWGDKEFYLAKEKTSGLAIKAVFWPTESVVHVVPVSRNLFPFVPDIEVEKLCLTDDEFLSLIDFIVNSFDKDSKGEVLELQTGIVGDSQFYKGVGDYYFMNTCNNWTAKGLQSVGMNTFSLFKLTADSVMRDAREFKQTLMKTNKDRLCGQAR
ncbi:MAG: TIGR02117 family protein [Methyloprofundus sp.]|nr:TIGR02117 family protein [Methyloprofundus sp.]